MLLSKIALHGDQRAKVRPLKELFGVFKTDCPTAPNSRLFEQSEIVNLPTFLITSPVSLKQQYNGFSAGNCLAKRNFKSSTECASDGGYRIVFTKGGFRRKSPFLVCRHRRCN